MRIGVPKEIKNNEFRVAMTPLGVREFTRYGHEVLIEKGAGIGSSISDEDYEKAGAKIAVDAQQVWRESEMIIKVKEPIESEYSLLREGQLLFTYLHLAAEEALTRNLLERGVTSIAYETVRTDSGTLPLLAPMSEVAGRLAAQVSAQYLLAYNGGSGVLFGGATGTRRGKVTVIGGGTAGYAAAKVAHGMGAEVTVFDVNLDRMRYIEDASLGQIRTEYSTELGIEAALKETDAVIGSVLVPGARTPHLVTNELVSAMRPGSVLVDIAIDQGGCFEGSRPTTHDDPVFKVHNSIFYCVANMPGSVPVTSTYALTNSTLRYGLLLAQNGWRDALKKRADLARGLSTHDGKLYSQPVGEALGIESAEVSELL